MYKWDLIILRAGDLKLSLIDGEILVAGNLTRHTLTLNEILESKVEMLRERLSLCSPLVKTQSICAKLSISNIDDVNLNQYDLIIDCTGENSLIELLEDSDFKDNKINKPFLKGTLF